jgi:hypothetical protein
MKPVNTTSFGPKRLLLGCALTLLSAHALSGNAFAAQPLEQGERGHAADTRAAIATDVSADMAVEADRAYSFIDPRTRRITALLIAHHRPAMTISIDPAADAVDVSMADGKASRVSITDLADAYAQGDAAQAGHDIGRDRTHYATGFDRQMGGRQHRQP